MLNSCHIMGRLGQDPEVRQTQSGKIVANFSIACDRDFKSQDGTKQTDWFPVVCFGTTADFVGRYLSKGRAVCVTGRLQVREWTDNNGGKRSATEILASNVYFADSPKSNDTPDNHSSGYQGTGQNGYPAGGYHNGGQNGYGGPGEYSNGGRYGG